MKITNIAIDKIKPYSKNPRKNDKAVPAVAASIKEFGFLIPMVLDRNNEIVCGHTRYKAAQQLGLKEVPCVIADELTPKQVKAFRVADNKTAELASWDFAMLQDTLAELEMDFNMGDFGFASMSDFNVDDIFVEHNASGNTSDSSGSSESEYEAEEMPETPAKRKVTCPCCGEEFEIEI